MAQLVAQKAEMRFVLGICNLWTLVLWEISIWSCSGWVSERTWAEISRDNGS